MDSVHRVGKGNSTGSHQSGVLAQAVAGSDVRCEAMLLQHLPYRYAGSQDSGLSEFGLHQLFIRAFKHHFGNRKSQCFVCFFNQCFDRIIFLIEILYHAYFLRTLSGKQKCSLHCITLQYSKF